MDSEKVNIETTGIGDVAAEILEEAKNLTTQQRIKIAQLFRELQAHNNAEAAKLYTEIHEVKHSVDVMNSRQRSGAKIARDLAQSAVGLIDKWFLNK